MAAARAGSRSACTATVYGPVRPVAGTHGGGLAGVVGAHAQDVPALRVGRDGSVHHGVVGAGHDEPGVSEVPGAVRPAHPGQPAPRRHVGQGRRALRGHDRDDRPGGEQTRHPAQRDGTTPDHDHPPPRRRSPSG